MSERHASRRSPMRTCIGCRQSVAKSNLLRVVVIEEGLTLTLVPDPRGRLPGRGAYVHPDLRCLDIAVRRRAFPRALRLPGPLDVTYVRQWIEHHRGPEVAEPPGSGDGAGRPTRGDGS